MLAVKDLTLHAGAFQVDGVSFEVAQGSCHILLGPTGSGKTLILESVAGLRRTRAGRICLVEQDITFTVPEQRNIAYLPQDLALFPTMTVKDNIGYSLRIKGSGKREKDAKIMSLASSLGIGGLLDRKIHNLSGGEKQRVALARALAAGSNLILLDEPLSSLHINLRREIWYLLQAIRKEHKLTFLMVTHDLDEALFLGDTISIIHAGLLLQTGTKKEVFNWPLSLDVARIVGVENFFPAFVERAKEDHLIIRIPAVDATFKVKKPTQGRLFGKNDRVILGIRANNLIPAEPGEKLAKTNAASFQVEGVYEKGSGVTILLKHASSRDTTAVVELHRNSCTAVPGQDINIIFPNEAIMIFACS